MYECPTCSKTLFKTPMVVFEGGLTGNVVELKYGTGWSCMSCCDGVFSLCDNSVTDFTE